MLLTCPTCRSGLEVPDGTTAMVRCPACKTVFSATEDTAPEHEEEEDEKPKAKVRKPTRKDEDEDDRPRKKSKKRDEEDEEEENRDFDPLTEEEEKKRKRKKRRSEDDDLTPEERAARRAAFQRAAWGARLIWISFVLYLLSMAIILLFYFQLGFKVIVPAYIIAAGFLGLLNWIIGAVGVGLCLSGPRAPGHWGYGISAAVAVLVHGVFLMVVVAQSDEFVAGRVGNDAGDFEGAERWGRLPTRIDATMFYLTFVFYSQNEGFTPKGKFLLSMICGIFEMTRTILIMMLLSCLARAALDEELAHKCTRAAGIASGGPGLTALVMLFLVAALVETNAGLNMFTLILIITVLMSVYAILMGVMMPAFMTAREVTDACEEPFQSLIPKL